MSRGQSHEGIDRTRVDAPRSPRTSGRRRGIAGRRDVVRAQAWRRLRSRKSRIHCTTRAWRTSAKLIAARELQSSDLTQQLLDRIAAVDGRLQSYVTLMADQALASARRADTEIAAGRYRGPLHGVPIAVKDLCYTRGVRTMAGTKVFADFVPDFDATVVARLECGRCGHPGQARPVRRRVRSVLSRPAGAGEPVGRHAMERRVIERLRRRHGSGLVLRVSRDRHGRIDPVSRRPRTDAWVSSPLTAG